MVSSTAPNQWLNLDHRAADAKVGSSDVEERVALQGQDALAVERVALAVPRVVAGRQQCGPDEDRVADLLLTGPRLALS